MTKWDIVGIISGIAVLIAYLWGYSNGVRSGVRIAHAKQREQSK